MANIPLVDSEGNLTGTALDRERLGVGKNSLEERIIPVVETFAFNRVGYILVQKRKDKKEYAGYTFPFHGGMVGEPDIREVNGIKGIYWEEAATRELRNETGIKASPQELELFGQHYTVFGSPEKKTYVSTHAIEYNPKTHGPIIPNKGEVDELWWITVSDAKKAGLFEVIKDVRIRNEIYEKVKRKSNEIRRRTYGSLGKRIMKYIWGENAALF